MSTLLSNAPLIFDSLADNITYDVETKRYRYKGNNKPGEPITGSFVSRDSVLKLQKDYLDKVTQKFIDLAPKIKAGEIGAYKEAAELLKRIHVSQGIIAANGIDNLTNSQLGTIGGILKQQYNAGKDPVTGKPYGLKRLFKEIQLDPNYSEAKLKQRLQLYAQSGEITRETVRQSIQAQKGLTEMKRVLGVTDNHCPECVEYASREWTIIGGLPLPKTRCSCRANCLCSIIYR